MKEDGSFSLTTQILSITSHCWAVQSSENEKALCKYRHLFLASFRKSLQTYCCCSLAPSFLWSCCFYRQCSGSWLEAAATAAGMAHTPGSMQGLGSYHTQEGSAAEDKCSWQRGPEVTTADIGNHPLPALHPELSAHPSPHLNPVSESGPGEPELTFRQRAHYLPKIPFTSLNTMSTIYITPCSY